MSLILPILFLIIELIVCLDFFKFVFKQERLFKSSSRSRILEVIVIVGFPLFYLSILDFGLENECCGDSATFSPDHQLTAYFWIEISVITFLISSFREELFSPILEVIVNAVLIIGFIFNVLVGFQTELLLWAIGNLPIGLLFLISLSENHLRIIREVHKDRFNNKSTATKYAWKLLTSKVIIKYPILLIIGIPVVFIASLILLLFGQKPDSIIQTFTQTYKHGFSELDYLCKNIECGGHYLCSVAANGHKQIVNPKRYGIRNGQLIICNRQLLVSNAFEDLVFELNPKVHKIIRHNYNKVGNKVHQYYYLFEYKLIADAIYYLMKPLEWSFIITLYLFDKNPENRIQTQYLNKEDKVKIETAYRNG